jgi:hypothetical protein
MHKNNYNKLDGLQGLKSVELISAIYESTLLGKEIFLDSQSRNFRLGQTK